MKGEYVAASDAIWDACGKDPSLYLSLIGNLKPRITPNRIYLTCPQCNQRSGWIIPGGKNIRCNHENNCGQETPVLSAFVGINDLLGGEQFKSAVGEACKLLGLPGPSGFQAQASGSRHHNSVSANMGNGNGKSGISPQSNIEALRTIWKVANEGIRGDGANDGHGRSYLIRRGFSSDFISANFGYIGCASSLKAVISEEDLKALGIGETWDKRVIIPCKDERGNLVALLGRSIDDRDDKYRYTHGYNKKDIFGLHLAKKHKHVLLVEGQMCVLKANQHGIQNIVAAGGTDFVSRMAILSKCGVERVTSFMDSDEAGRKGTEKLIQAFDTDPDCPELYIGSLAGAGKDIDEALQTISGLVLLRTAMEAPHAYSYRAFEWFDIADIPRYIDRCAKYADSITSARLKLRIDQYFLPEVCALSGISLDRIQEVRKEYESRRIAEDATREFKGLLQTALKLSDGGISNESKRLITKANHIAPNGANQQIPSGSTALTELRGYFQKVSERPLIGIPSSFPTIDRDMSGLHKLTLLAGDTNVGKTVMLGQMAAHAALYEDACVLFLSFEMLRREIFARMWCAYTGASWHDLKQCYRDGVSDRMEEILEDSGLLDNVRVVHPRLDRWFRFSPEMVLEERRKLIQATGRQRCLTILDYFQSLPSPPGMSPFDAEQANVDNLLEIKDGMEEDDPLLVVSAVNKGDSKFEDAPITLKRIMGASKLPYSCDNILIWNRFSNQMLYENFIISRGAMVPMTEPEEVNWETERKKAEVKEAVRNMKLAMQRAGRSFGAIEIAKGRDGTTKSQFNITMLYQQNRIVEGLEM